MSSRLAETLRTYAERIELLVDARERLERWHAKCNTPSIGCYQGAYGLKPPVSDEVRRLLSLEPECERSHPCIRAELEQLLTEVAGVKDPRLPGDAPTVTTARGRLYSSAQSNPAHAAEPLLDDPSMTESPNDSTRHVLADYAKRATGAWARITTSPPTRPAQPAAAALARRSPRRFPHPPGLHGPRQ